MPPQRLIVNDVDMSAYGMWVDTPQGWGSATSRDDAAMSIRAAGDLIDPLNPRMRGREVGLPGILIATSPTEARDLWDAAKLVLSSVWLEVMIVPWTDRICVCRYRSLDWSPQLWTDAGFRFTLNLHAASAYLVSPLVDTYGLEAGAEHPLVLGTAPSPFTVRFIGLAAAPALVYRDANGQQQGRIALTTTLLEGEWVEFDSQTLQLVRHGATGLLSNGAPFFESSSVLFHLDPLDGTPTVGPTLTLSSGRALLTTRKCWA